MGNNGKFLRIGIIYTIGQLLSKAVSFIMIPIYTRELGTIGFGQLALVDTVMNFINTLVIFSIYSGYIRFYRDYKEEERNRLRNTAITFALVMVVANLILTATLGNIISRIAFNFSNSYEIFILMVIRSLISQFITLLMCDYNLNYNAKKTVAIEFILMILNISFSIYFVVIKKQAVIGIYKGYIYSSIVVLIYMIIEQFNRLKIEFDKEMFKNMFKFSFGLIPCGISATILDLADRYFLSGYKGFTQTGIYSMGYKVGMLIDPIFISPFKSIFTPFKFEMWKDKDSKKKINEMFINYHFIGCFVILGITVFSKIIILILSSKEYIGAVNLIPIILFSYFLYGENEFFSLGIQVKNKTYITSIIMLVGGVLNIVLNIVLIPKYGMYGAAFTTLISYIVINFINLQISKKFYDIKYNLKSAYIVDCVAIITYLIYSLTIQFIDNIIIELLIGVISIIIYLLLMLKFKIINYNSIKNLILKK